MRKLVVISYAKNFVYNSSCKTYIFLRVSYQQKKQKIFHKNIFMFHLLDTLDFSFRYVEQVRTCYFRLFRCQKLDIG